MLAIYFEDQDNCTRLAKKIAIAIKQFHKLGINATMEQREGNELRFLLTDETDQSDDPYYSFLAALLTEDLIKTKEHLLLKQYAYTDFHLVEEEQRQVVSIAQAIFNEDREDGVSKRLASSRCTALYQAFFHQMKAQKTLFYEPFLTFRMKAYTEIVLDCLELAVDEYWLEQEHQTTLDVIRQTVEQQKTKRRLIYLVHDETFRFYDDAFRELTKDECHFYMSEKTADHTVVGKMEYLILTLIEMSPEYIYLFTKQPDHHTILLIQSIYQERLKVYPFERYATTSGK
ncbi:sporulation protein YtxC [Shouchella lehensis]|uniref:Sporulation protein YtxC n=1 Tax=Shouchella lehensis G1 TaxID=1246626 RepID=A0A060LVG8_9BACI|nr:sporulation protein YtxC [Shouchella lehensis]AIC95256.1 sporulation protein YtxC [Shouchella lehensis G1]RQW21070.1 hypothetical protein EH196_13495 [Bacillus sp. C1-1]